MSVAQPTARRWTLEEYYHMGELGFFNDQRVELLDGRIMEMAPQGSEHFASICLCGEAVRAGFGGGWVVRVQGPLRIGDSEPEPDIAVVPGQPRDYAGKTHPSQPSLVIEVSDSSLEFDRTDKASLYASAGVEDYWIVNLIERCVEVHRRPAADAAGRFGFRYAERTVFTTGAHVKPLAIAGDISLADLLP